MFYNMFWILEIGNWKLALRLRSVTEIGYWKLALRLSDRNWILDITVLIDTNRFTYIERSIQWKTCQCLKDLTVFNLLNKLKIKASTSLINQKWGPKLQTSHSFSL